MPSAWIWDRREKYYSRATCKHPWPHRATFQVWVLFRHGWASPYAVAPSRPRTWFWAFRIPTWSDAPASGSCSAVLSLAIARWQAWAPQFLYFIQERPSPTFWSYVATCSGSGAPVSSHWHWIVCWSWCCSSRTRMPSCRFASVQSLCARTALCHWLHLRLIVKFCSSPPASHYLLGCWGQLSSGWDVSDQRWLCLYSIAGSAACELPLKCCLRIHSYS